MIHLVQATRLTRITLRWIIITIVSGISLFILYNIALFVKSILYPPPAPQFGIKFGNLPSVEFPPPTSLPIYKLNTVNGVLPEFPDRINVYKMQEKDPNLLGLTNARLKMRAIRFTANEIKISPAVYQWKSLDPPERFIQFDIVSESFNLFSNYSENPDVLLARFLPSEKEARRRIDNFLGRLGEDGMDFDNDKTQFTYFTISNKKLRRVGGLNEAQIIQVDLFQKQVSKMDIYYPYTYFNESLMKFLIGSGPDTYEIMETHYVHQKADEKTFSDYPIITSSQAFENLKAGKAYIFNPEGVAQVEITDIQLAYYIGEKSQKYLMPIIVFRGNHSFKAYVIAIPDSLISK